MNKEEYKKISEAYLSKGFYMPEWNNHFKAYLLLKKGCPYERVLFYDKEQIKDIEGNIKYFEDQSLKNNLDK